MAEIIERLPFEKYLALPGDSSSSLRLMLKSPLHYKSAKTSPREETKALKIGRFGHTMILEGDRALLDCAVWRNDKDGQPRRRAGKEWEAFVEANQGKTILNESEYTDVLRMRDAARAHPVAAPLLNGPGRNELSIKWAHERTGRACKSRLDRVIDGCVVDIKTTRDPSPRKFGRDVFDFGYLLQAAFYVDAAAAAGLGECAFRIVAVQNCEPFDCVVHIFTRAQLAQGRDQYNAAIDKLLECESTGKWPGVAQNEVELELPSWALPQFDEEEAIEWGSEVIQ